MMQTLCALYSRSQSRSQSGSLQRITNGKLLPSAEAPEGTLRRQSKNPQNSCRHGLALEKPQMVQSREAHVAGQHHRQDELIPWHGPGLPLHFRSEEHTSELP